MGRAELASENGEVMRMLVDGSATRRLGTPEDIAAAAEFLLSPAASFITGTNLLVDGGVCSTIRFGG
jgi:NAD(P)-dependent dehydrogenase (short-subunit alcohol dehydrogenase family)